MPNYLSPGVYVEEVSGRLAPDRGRRHRRRRLRRPGRARARQRSRPWSRTGRQFAQTFGDFMEGSYLAHAVYGYFLNGGGAATSCASAPTATRARSPQRRAPARPRQGRAAVSASPRSRPARPATTSRSRSPTPSEPGEDIFKLIVDARRQGRGDVYDNVTMKKGKTQRRHRGQGASKLIQLEELGERRRVDRSRRRRACRSSGGDARCRVRVTPDDYVGNSADRTGFAGLEAIDEVTMLARARPDGRLPARHHRPRGRAGRAARDDRPLRADGRPRRDPRRAARLNAQQVKEWRVDKAGYDSKYATLYWPWIKVFDPLAGPGGSCPAERPHGRHLGAQRRHARRAQGAGQRGRPRRDLARAADHQGRARPAQPVGHQLHPRVPGPRHPRLGRAHAVERSGVALPQRAPALQLRRGVDPRGHAVGGVRAERLAPLGRASSATITRSCARVWRDGALFGATPDEAFYVKCDAENNPPGHRSTSASSSSRSASHRSSRPSSSSSASRSSPAAPAVERVTSESEDDQQVLRSAACPTTPSRADALLDHDRRRTRSRSSPELRGSPPRST